MEVSRGMKQVVPFSLTVGVVKISLHDATTA